MKRNQILAFLILFLLSNAAFAGITSLANESEKPAAASNREVKLSAEELSRLSRRAETDNLKISDISTSEKNNAKSKLIAPKQYERNHRGYYYGGAGLLLVVILVIILI